LIPYQSATTVFSGGTLPDRTFALDFDKKRVSGTVSGIDAVNQAAFLILQTQRYGHLIYSYQYGTELNDLLGRPVSYAYPEIKRRITEALTQDDRIQGVSDFEFSRSQGSVCVSFVVHSIYGDSQLEADL